MVTFEQVAYLAECLDAESLQMLKTAKKPYKIGRHIVPENLNDLTVEQLSVLLTPEENRLYVFAVFETLFNCKPKSVLRLPATTVFGVMNWVAEELEKINAMFAAEKVEPTKEEKLAGCEELDFGFFGFVDWYAKRMNFQSHDEVGKLKWIILYECMRIDNERTRYERRLQKVYEQQAKAKK